ncbi:MAG TPA: imidazole glycerol phosphate synthase subunit HisH [Alphaproteobacteria bacterium]|nr:imidazole glycerol phosphate synthase subunit HisH [Alphaproteobacteria bacterium]
MSKIVIVDYGSGNLRSAAKAFERAAADIGLKDAVSVSADAKDLATADRIVLPGVGAFGDCKRGLEALPGMIDALNEQVLEKKKPFFGICVGMQLMAEFGREHGEHRGLGWIKGVVEAILPADPSLKVPHMGWNELKFARAHPLFAGLGENRDAYFVHSYQLKAANPADVIATVDYGGPIVAAVGRDNIVGTQFHPEKSQANGLAIIANFLRWRP